jgi:FkbM family methyltransferase
MKSKKTSLHSKLKAGVNQLLSPAGVKLVRRPADLPQGIISFVLGKYTLLIHGENTLWQEYGKNSGYTGELGRLARCVFQHYPQAAMIDVGANIGDTAAMVKSVADVPVICIEGDVGAFQLLERNIAAMKEVSAYQCFLGAKTETAAFLTQKEGWDTTLIPVSDAGAGEAKKIELITLDDFLRQRRPSLPCKLLKVDVEGFDARVLRGATDLLGRNRPALMFELNHENLTKLPEPGLGIFPFLSDLGYEDLLIYDGQGHFMFPGKTADTSFLNDIYDYAQSVEELFYYDICAFHRDDTALAAEFLVSERQHRKRSS